MPGESMIRITANEAGGTNVLAFMQTIKASEGTAHLGDDGYNIIVGGQQFTSYDDHPRVAVRTRWGWSDAAGAYQIMAAIPGKITTDTWDWAHRAAGVKDFSPLSQDRVCVYLLMHLRAIDDIKAGRFSAAVEKCAKTWASFTGAGYGQRENDMGKLRAFYLEAGGRILERT